MEKKCFRNAKDLFTNYMKKKALIFGITGQDGSYLAEYLIKKNYIVHGVKRKSSSFNTKRIDHIFCLLYTSPSPRDA